MKLTQTDKRNIVAAIQSEKATMTELAERYNVSISAIGYTLKKMTGMGLKPQLSQSDRKAIVTTLRSGEATIQKLATRYNVQPETISRNFKHITGKSFGAPRVPVKLKKAIIEEIRTNDNVTKQELTDKYGIHITTLERIIKQVTGKTFRSLRQRPTTQISQTSHMKRMDVVQLLTKLSQENPNRKIMYDLKNGEISVQ